MSEIETVDTADNEAQSMSLDDLARDLSGIGEPDEGLQAPQNPEVDSSQSQPDGDPETSEAEAEPDESPETLTVKGLAEKLGIDAKELYQSVSIDLGEGQTLTLGELKDRGKDLLQSEALLANASEQQLEIENELLVKRQQLNVEAQRLGVEFTPEQSADHRRTIEAYQDDQVRKALQIMPDWQDKATREADLTRIDKITRQYGFSEAEQSTILDARLLKVFRDFQRQRDTLARFKKEKVHSKGKQSPSSLTRSSDKVTEIAAQNKAGTLSSGDAVKGLAAYL